MPSGDSASWSATARSKATVDWETDFSASQAVPKKAKFDIDEGNAPPIVAQNLADAFNSKNEPSFSATATGAKVVFKAEDSKHTVTGMRFTIDNHTDNLPGNGADVTVGNTGMSVKRV